ncbi:unnamed protein product, partial [Rotaria magnacalcarata]
LPNSSIYLKLHSILTLLFKSLRLLEFIFEVIFYIERLKFLSSHFIQHYFRSRYSLQVSFNFEKASLVQVVHLNNISDRNTFLNLKVHLKTLCFVQLAELKNISAKFNFENSFLRTNHYATEWYSKSFYIQQYTRFFIVIAKLNNSANNFNAKTTIILLYCMIIKPKY